MSRDLDQYHRQTIKRLVIGAIVIIYVLGGVLIYLIYGPAAAGMGLLCLTLGLLPVAFILLFFWLADWIVRRNRQ